MATCQNLISKYGHFTYTATLGFFFLLMWWLEPFFVTIYFPKKLLKSPHFQRANQKYRRMLESFYFGIKKWLHLVVDDGLKRKRTLFTRCYGELWVYFWGTLWNFPILWTLLLVWSLNLPYRWPPLCKGEPLVVKGIFKTLFWLVKYAITKCWRK